MSDLQDDYRRQIEERNAQQDSVLRATLTHAVGENPEAAAKAKHLSVVTGIPRAVVARNPDMVDRRVRTDQYARELADHPALARRYADPDFAAGNHEDIPVYARLGLTVKAFAQRASQMGWTAAGDAARALDQANVVGSLPLNLLDRALGDGRVTLPPALLGDFAERTRARVQGAAEATERRSVEGLAPATRDAVSGIQSAVTNTSALVTAVLTRRPDLVLPFMGAMTYSGAKGEALKAGLSQTDATIHGTTQAGWEVIFEKTPLESLFKSLGGGEGFLKTLGKQLGIENLTEQATTLTQDASEWAQLHPDKTLAEFIAERPQAALSTLIATTVGAGAQTSAVFAADAGMKALDARERAARESAQIEQVTQALQTAAAQAKAAQLDPDSFAQGVTAAAEDSDATEVFIRARSIDELFQDKAPELLQALPEVAAQYEEALAADGDLVIPIGQFAAQLVTNEKARPLLDHVRYAADQLSPAEAKVEIAAQRQQLEVEAERILTERVDDAAFQAGAESVRTQLAAQLQQTGRFRPEVQSAYTQIASAFYTTQAARLGITPERLFEQMPLNVAATALPGLALMQSADAVSLRDWTEGDGNPDFLLHITEPAHIPSIERDGLRAAGDGYSYAWDSRLDAESDQIMREARMARGMSYDEAADAGFAFIAVNRAAVADRIETDPHTGEVRIVGDVPADAIRVLNSESMGTLEQATRAAYSPSTNTITLLETADLSSFLHELGHAQLEMLFALAEREGAPVEIKRDAEALLAWFGVADLAAWRAMSLDQQRPHHEQFARGFEAYLFEGNAPNDAMRGIFQRFSAWLKHVYKRLSALNVQLTPEVRGVMDRLVATDQQIAEARARAGFYPLFKSAEEAGMTPGQWVEYQDLGRAGIEAATDELQARSLKDMQWLSRARGRELAKLQKRHDALRKGIEAEVRAEVEAEDLYRAIRFLRTGEVRMADGEEVKATAGHRLERAEVEALFPPDAPGAVDLTPLAGLLQKDGLPVQTVAEMFGFQTGESLVKALLAAPPVDQAIADRTDDRMLERHGELIDPAALEAAADAAVHNQLRAKLVAAELTALDRALNATEETGAADKRVRRLKANAMVQAAREYARQAIAARTAREIARQGLYRQAERRAAREAVAALKAGDLAEAVRAKRSEVLAGELTAAAAKADEEIAKARRYFRRVQGSEALDVDYREQIDTILERFDLRGVSVKAAARRQNLLEWVEAQREAGFEPDIPPALLDEAQRKPFQDLTLDEIRGLRDTVKQIEHLGRLKHRLLTDRANREFAQVAEELTAGLAAHAGAPRNNRAAFTAGERVGELFREFFAEHRRVASLANQFDGGADGGAWWTAFIAPMNEAGTREVVMREEATLKLAALLPLLDGAPMASTTDVPGVGPMRREERISAVLNMGNAGNRQRLASGYQWTEEQLQAIADSLTLPETQYVQAVWDLLEEYRPLVAAKERRVNGVEPTWVEPTPVETRHGTLRGGYYPVRYDQRASQKAAEHGSAEEAVQALRAAYTAATTRRSFTKARAKEVHNRPILLTQDAMWNGLNEVIHDLAWHEWLIDATRLIRATGQAMRNHYGAETVKQFTDALRDIATGDAQRQTAFERIMGHLRKGTTVVGLGWNFVTAAMQTTGLTQTAVRIGSRWMLRGLADYVAHPKAATEFAYSRSMFLRLRAKTMNREIREIRNRLRRENAWRNGIDHSAFWMIAKMQSTVDVPTWHGAYQKALAAGESEERSIGLADQAVIDAQGDGQIHNLSAMQRGGPLKKLFTNFISYLNTTWNLAAQRTRNTDLKNPAEIASLAVDYALLYVVPAVAAVLIRSAFSPDDEDEEELAKRLMAEGIGFFFGQFIGLREVAFGAQKLAGVDTFTMGYSGPAGTRLFAELGKLGKQTRQIFEDGFDPDEFDEPFLKSLASVAGIVLHLPTTQVVKTIDGALALIEGDTDNPAALVSGGPRN